MRNVIRAVTLRYSDNSCTIIVWRTRKEAQAQFNRATLLPGGSRSINPIPLSELSDYILRVKSRHPNTVCVCLDDC